VGFSKVLLVTGRSQYKHCGLLGRLGKILDPLFDIATIRGMLYVEGKL
jgi:hypothetical protein